MSAVRASVARLATWSAWLLVVGVAAVAVLYAVGLLWMVVLPVLLGLLLATVLWPPARVLRRWLPDAAAAGLVLLVGLVALGGVGTAVVSLVVDEAESLADAVVGGLEDVQDWASGPPLSLGDDGLGALVERATDELQQNAQQLAGLTATGVATAGHLLVTGLLALVMCFFILKDGPAFLPWTARWVSPAAAPHVDELGRRSWAALSGFIRAQALVGLADAVGIWLGLVVLGVPLALPLAVLTFFGAFIPIVGAVATGVLAVLVALVTGGPTTALLVVLVVVVVQQLESNLLSPLLMGRTLRLYPALVILAVTAGGSLWGIVGAFLAVPVLAVATVVVRYAKEQHDLQRAGPVASPQPEPERGEEEHREEDRHAG